MAGIEFDVIITKEGIDYARQAQGGIGKGWHLTPKRFEISSIASGIFNDTRNLASRNETWIARTFSGIYPLGSNKLLTNITIPADARNSAIAIKEVYFIYENHDDDNSTEFLFAIARPTIDLDFIPGVSQSFKFLFAINNIDNIESIIDIKYTYPEEISDHNLDLNAHEDLVKRDGSRKITGILSYDTEKTFNSNLDLVTKGYIDNLITTKVNQLQTKINEVQENINEAIYPIGEIKVTLNNTLASNEIWLEGQSLDKVGKYAALYAVYGTTYGSVDSFHFTLPDLRGRVLWGSDESNLKTNQGLIEAGLPNITGTVHFGATNGGSGGGAFYAAYNAGVGDGDGDGGVYNPVIGFDASRSNSIYGKSTTVQPPAFKVRFKTRFK